MTAKLQVRSIKRLIAATSDFNRSAQVVEDQVGRIQERLNRGVDVTGRTFAPYKDPERWHPNSRPLEKAARLFEGARSAQSHNFEGIELKSSIYGLPAKIARYQNFRRRFLGYSREDRAEARRAIVHMIKVAFKNGRVLTWR